MRHIILFLILAVLCVGMASAVPTTDAATSVSQYNVTFNGHGGVTDCWFSWGQTVGSAGYLKTDNDTTCSGVWLQDGSPLLTSTTYYVRYCDVTGCGAQQTFTTPTVVMTPRTQFGSIFMTTIRRATNVTALSYGMFYPYTKTLSTVAGSDNGSNTYGTGIFVGFIYMVILFVLWRQQRSVTTLIILSMIAVPLVVYISALPPMFAVFGEALLLLALGGYLVTLFKR